MFSGLYSIYLYTSVLLANSGSRTQSNSICIYIHLLPELAGNTDVYKEIEYKTENVLLLQNRYPLW